MVGSVSYVSGVSGNAIQLDAGELINISGSSAPQSSNPVTLMCFAKLSDSGNDIYLLGYPDIVGAAKVHYITKAASNKWMAWGYSNDVSSSTTYTAGVWTHVANAYNGTSYLYVNGTSTGTPLTYTAAVVNNNLIINNAGSTTIYLDECAVFNYSIAPTNISSIKTRIESGEKWSDALTPSLSLVTNFSNNTQVYQGSNVSVNFNGTLTYSTTNYYNCSFYNGNSLNSSLSNIDITLNNVFNITLDTIGSFNLSINCSNFEANSNTGKYNYSVVVIPSNVTINVSSNMTALENYTYLNYLETKQIREAVDMIPIVLLYIAFLVVGIYCLTRDNVLVGFILLFINLALDFLLVKVYWQKYVDVTITNDAYGILTYIFGICLLIWLVLKLILPFAIKYRRKA